MFDAKVTFASGAYSSLALTVELPDPADQVGANQ